MKGFSQNWHYGRERNSGRAGFSLAELMVVLAVGMIMTAVSIPVLGSALARAKMNSDVGTISATISKNRYLALRDSDVYTMVITAPQNTYVVSDVTKGAVGIVEPLPKEVSLNGGVAGTYTYTFCPNGTVYGAGGCPNGNLPPGLAVTYKTLQTNIAVSTVGNVKTTTIH